MGNQSVTMKACWSVTAGVIPGQPIESLSRNWFMTAEEFESEHCAHIITSYIAQASFYAQRIQDPNQVNWVKMEFKWF